MTQDRTRREFLEDSLLAAAAAATLPLASCAGTRTRVSAGRPFPKNEKIRMAVVGVRGRGRAHVGAFKKAPGAEVVAICDPDEGVIGGAMQAVPGMSYYRDIRDLLADDRIDAISIATPNHWHSLAALWGLQAGKHVYVEKPLSHNLKEGRRVVQEAERSGLILQHGTQSRSYPATMEAMAFLRSGGLGKVHLARGLCYKPRGSIGKVKGPQKPPASCDYGLWTGPAELRPLMRKHLHYDWHWDFNTGNGDIGNQGVHQMDIARWGLGIDHLPSRVLALGGRLGYDDDGNTPNTMLSLYDYGAQRILFEVRGLKTAPYRKLKIGVVFHCEHGYLAIGSYSKAVAFDKDGKVLKVWNGAGNHFQNFLDAVRSGRVDDLHAPCIEGHMSASLCHLGNISYRMGHSVQLSATDSPFGDEESGNEAFRRFRSHLVENGLSADGTSYAMGEELRFDPATEQFLGARAEEANRLLTRPYRAPFVVPPPAAL